MITLLPFLHQARMHAFVPQKDQLSHLRSMFEYEFSPKAHEVKYNKPKDDNIVAVLNNLNLIRKNLGLPPAVSNRCIKFCERFAAKCRHFPLPDTISVKVEPLAHQYASSQSESIHDNKNRKVAHDDELILAAALVLVIDDKNFFRQRTRDIQSCVDLYVRGATYNSFGLRDETTIDIFDARDGISSRTVYYPNVTMASSPRQLVTRLEPQYTYKLTLPSNDI